MTASPFQRPGATPADGPAEWPYEPSEPVSDGHLDDDPRSDDVVAPPEPAPEDQPAVLEAEPSESWSKAGPARGRRARRQPWLIAAALLLGVAVGVGTSALWPRPAPAPIPIRLSSFPETLGDATRADRRLAADGQPGAAAAMVEQFTRDIKGFEFSYGGPGGTFRYTGSDGAGQFNLLIVNGQVVLPLPKNPQSTLDGSSYPGVVVAVDHDGVKCVVLPTSSEIDPDTGKPVPVDVSTAGDVYCALWDPERRLSLGLLDDGRGLPDSGERASRFEAMLRDLHRDLTN